LFCQYAELTIYPYRENNYLAEIDEINQCEQVREYNQWNECSFEKFYRRWKPQLLGYIYGYRFLLL
jgi:hypothetical protein